jgi:hypothetical protein
LLIGVATTACWSAVTPQSAYAIGLRELKMAQLIERIDLQLSKESDDFVAAELLAKKAAYLGRVGRANEAQEIIQFVRRTFNDGRSGRVTCLLLIAEGILLHLALRSGDALDKVSRATLLAQGLRHPDLIGICAVWKGFIDFDLSRFDSMQRSLLLIRDLGLESDHAVMSRMAVTLMTAGLMIGDRDFANRWFRVGHTHSVAEGDLACIEALLFNRAVFGLARQRVAWCTGVIDKGWSKAIRAELESARNLESLAGISTLSDHLDLCVARLDLIEDHANEALTRFRSLQLLERFSGKHVNEVALRIDTLYLENQIGSSPGLADQLTSIDLDQISSLDPDERLVALTLLDRMTHFCHPSEKPPTFAPQLDAARIEYDEYEDQLKSALSPWLAA